MTDITPTETPAPHFSSKSPRAKAPGGSKPEPVGSPASGAGWQPPRPSHLTTALIASVGVAGILAVLYAWHLWPFTSAIERTEDAYVRGNTTVISPQVSGYVTAVLVKDYDQVKVGQELVMIDDRIYEQRVEVARAAVHAAVANRENSYQSQRSREAALKSQSAAAFDARAQLTRAEADMRRVDDLVTDGSVSQREEDRTRAALKQAQAALLQAKAARAIALEDIRVVIVNRDSLRAAVESAKAKLRLAAIDLEHTVITAPDDGQLSEIGVRLGQYVTNGTQLFFLVPPHPWLIANYKEEQTARMRIGQNVTFTVDALAGATLTGHIEELAPATGSEFSVLKADNATGNFTKVPQRISVRIAVDPGQPLAKRLRPGMSVETDVDTASRGVP
jgi:multidrug resistance efflux pump